MRDPIKSKERQKRYREKNAEKEKLRREKWRRENPEKDKVAKEKWKLENPEKKKAAEKKWLEKNKEKRKTAIKTWRKKNPEKYKLQVQRHSRRSHLRRNYGLSKEEYDLMVSAQNGHCQICNQADSSGRKLVVDHCHKTGKVRGLLCNRHNTGLGSFSDDPQLLRMAISYLEKYDIVGT